MSPGDIVKILIVNNNSSEYDLTFVLDIGSYAIPHLVFIAGAYLNLAGAESTLYYDGASKGLEIPYLNLINVDFELPDGIDEFVRELRVESHVSDVNFVRTARFQTP
jgi:hypothetical protein